MDQVQRRVGSRIGRRVAVLLFGLLAVLVGLGSVAAACVSHTAAGGNHHDVVSTECDDHPDCDDQYGNGGTGGGLPDLDPGVEADSGTGVVSTVTLAMADGGICVAGTVCTQPTNQTDSFVIRLAGSISLCDSSTNTVSGPHLGRNFVADWDAPSPATVPTTYIACVAPASGGVGLGGTYVGITVY